MNQRIHDASQDLYERICDGVPSSVALDQVCSEWSLTDEEYEEVIWAQANPS